MMINENKLESLVKEALRVCPQAKDDQRMLISYVWVKWERPHLEVDNDALNKMYNYLIRRPLVEDISAARFVVEVIEPNDVKDKLNIEEAKKEVAKEMPTGTQLDFDKLTAREKLKALRGGMK